MPAYYQPLVRLFKGSVIVATTNAYNRAVRDAARELPSVVTALGQSFDRRAFPERQFKETNLRIAEAAQKAVLSGWRSRLPRRSRRYRKDDRLTGTLGPALADPAMLSGTSAHVISFVNEKFLAQTAQHWYRVNYGAMGPKMAGSKEKKTYQINLLNQPFTVLRDDLKPAPTNWLPRTFEWNDTIRKSGRKKRTGNQGEMINVLGRAKPTGKGARAARFTDLGLQKVAEQFPKEYDRTFRAWLQDGTGNARKKLSDKNIEVITDVRLDRYGFKVHVR